jgi:glycosyltransferase involved in cell wall biosynthesis
VGYVCPVDKHAIAEALVQFAEMPAEEREKQFGENIKKEKQKYAWSVMTAAILNS